MDFNRQANILKETLELQKEPIAVRFSIERMEFDVKTKTPMCLALKMASEGESFVVSMDSSSCPGGNWHCGLTNPPVESQKRKIQRFLTKGEKLYYSVTAFERSQQLIQSPPTGLADNIIIIPLEDETLRPDLVIFMVNPEQGCRLLHLDSYWDGIPPKVEPSGAMCHAVISYSVMTGQTNLTLGDWTARKHHHFEEDLMFITVPYERLENIIKAISLCSAGKAHVVFPDDL